MTTNNSKQALLDLLWLQFEQKLGKEWQKYAAFGKSIYQIDDRRKINFYEQISQDIEKKLGNKQTLSSATIGRMVEAKKINSETKKQTLDIICRYVGYESWLNFEKKNEHLAIERTGLTDMAQQTPLLRHLTNSNSKTKGKYSVKNVFVGFVGMFVLGSLVWFSLATSGKNASGTKQQFTKQEKKYFDAFIRSANQRAFDVMTKNCPLTDSALQVPTIHRSLDEFYTQKGTARSTILGYITQATRYNRAYCIPPSNHNVVYVKCLEKTETTVTLETKEHWYLLVKNKLTGKEERIYDNLNTQIYILIKENNTWKIDINKYEGTSRKVSK